MSLSIFSAKSDDKNFASNLIGQFNNFSEAFSIIFFINLSATYTKNRKEPSLIPYSANSPFVLALESLSPDIQVSNKNILFIGFNIISSVIFESDEEPNDGAFFCFFI